MDSFVLYIKRCQYASKEVQNKQDRLHAALFYHEITRGHMTVLVGLHYISYFYRNRAMIWRNNHIAKDTQKFFMLVERKYQQKTAL